MDTFLTEQAKFSRELSRAMMLTLQKSPERTERALDFTGFAALVKARSLNVTGGKNEKDGIPKSTQQMYPNYEDDLWNIWDYFGKEHERGYEYAKQVAISLFDRRLLGYNEHLQCRVALNYSSKYIFRDSNLSVSLVDENNREIGLVGFFILPGGVVEIIQLQCKKKYGANGEHFSALVSELRALLEGLGFKKLRIIRSEKLFITKTPTVLPSSVTDDKSLQEWMHKHELHMKLTYDVNPLRKWGFHRPKNPELAEDYSGEMDL